MAHKICAGPMIGTGAVFAKAVAADEYRNPTETATAQEYAASKLVTRFRLRIETARLVCRLAGLGGVA